MSDLVIKKLNLLVFKRFYDKSAQTNLSKKMWAQTSEHCYKVLNIIWNALYLIV